MRKTARIKTIAPGNLADVDAGAPEDCKIACGKARRGVARAEPSVGSERRGGGVRFAQVAARKKGKDSRESTTSNLSSELTPAHPSNIATLCTCSSPGTFTRVLAICARRRECVGILFKKKNTKAKTDVRTPRTHHAAV